MPFKNKKSPSTPRRGYSTREIMELTEQRRQKMDAAWKETESKVKPLETQPAPAAEEVKPPLLVPSAVTPQINEQIKTFVDQVNQRPYQEAIEDTNEDPKEEFKEEVKLEEEPKEEVKEEIKELVQKPKISAANNFVGPVVFFLSLSASFLMISFKSPEFWINLVAAKINFVVLYGSLLVLNLLQGSCALSGAVLSTHYYKISLQGDWLSLYSLTALFVLASLIASFKKTTLIRSTGIFISLVPLAIIANILRVVLACGAAFNYGPVLADRYFHGILAGIVFAFILLGLVLLEYLFSPDANENEP